MVRDLAPPSVWYGLLSYRRWVDIGTTWLMIHSHLDRRITPLGNSTIYMSATDTGRNQVMRVAIGTDAEYLWFIDDDTHVNGDQNAALRLVDMILCAQRVGATIMSPPAPIHGDGEMVSAPNVISDDLQTRKAWHEVTGVQQVGGVGTACMVVDLAWVREHWPVGPWFNTLHNDKGLLRGSDYGFCQDVRGLGGTVWSYGKQWVHNWNQVLPDRDKLAKHRLKKGK